MRDESLILFNCDGSEDDDVLCLNCTEDMNKNSLFGECTECPSPTLLSLIIFGTLIWFIFFILCLSFLLSKTNIDIASESKLYNICLFTLRRLLFHFQVIGCLVFISVSFTQPATEFFIFSEVISLSGLNWSNCLLESFNLNNSILYVKILIASVAPVAAVVIVFLFAALIYLNETRKIYQDRLTYSDIKRRTFSVFYALFMIAQPLFWKIGFSPFACVEKDGTLYLLQDNAIDCDSRTHKRVSWYFGIVLLIIIYGGGSLCYLFYYYRMKWIKNKSLQPQHLFQILSVNLFASVIVLTQLDKAKQFLLTFLVLGIYSFLTFRLKETVLLDRLSACILLLSLLLASLLGQDLNLSKDDFSPNFLNIVIILINALFLSVNLFYILSCYSKQVLKEQQGNDTQLYVSDENEGNEYNKKSVLSKTRFWIFINRISVVLSLNVGYVQDNQLGFSKIVMKKSDFQVHKSEADEWKNVNLNISKLQEIFNMKNIKDNGPPDLNTVESDAISLSSKISSSSSMFDETEEFEENEEVVIRGLKKNCNYNDQLAYFIQFCPNRKRIEVKLKNEDTILRLKRKNIFKTLDCCSEANSVASFKSDVDVLDFAPEEKVYLCGLKKQMHFEGLPATFIKTIDMNGKKRVEVKLNNGTILRLKAKNIERKRDEDTFTVFSDHSASSSATQFDIFSENLNEQSKLRIVNLKKAELRAAYEGKIGKFQAIDNKTNRVAVLLSNGAILKLKTKNLEVEDDVISLAPTERTAHRNRAKTGDTEFSSGDKVEIINLRKNKEYNGKQGRFVRVDAQDGKADIEFTDGTVLRLKPKNLSKISDYEYLNAVTTKNTEAVTTVTLNEDLFNKDDLVVIENLKKMPQLNGKEGKLLKLLFDKKKGEVELKDGTIILLRLKNLKKIDKEVVKPKLHFSDKQNEYQNRISQLEDENRKLRCEVELLASINKKAIQKM